MSAAAVRARLKLEIEDTPFAPNAAALRDSEAAMTIPSGGQAHVTLHADHSLTQPEFDDLVGGAKQLKAFGEITFSSNPKRALAFPGVTFCFESDPPVQGTVKCKQ